MLGNACVMTRGKGGRYCAWQRRRHRRRFRTREEQKDDDDNKDDAVEGRVRRKGRIHPVGAIARSPRHIQARISRSCRSSGRSRGTQERIMAAKGRSEPVKAANNERRGTGDRSRGFCHRRDITDIRLLVGCAAEIRLRDSTVQLMIIQTII